MEFTERKNILNIRQYSHARPWERSFRILLLLKYTTFEGEKTLDGFCGQENKVMARSSNKYCIATYADKLAVYRTMYHLLGRSWRGRRQVYTEDHIPKLLYFDM